jgi:hypothetical protein
MRNPGAVFAHINGHAGFAADRWFARPQYGMIGSDRPVEGERANNHAKAPGPSVLDA